MKKIYIELSAAEAMILAAAVIMTATAIKKTLLTKEREADLSYNISDMSIAAVSDAILTSPAAEYVFGERDNGVDAV